MEGRPLSPVIAATRRAVTVLFLPVDYSCIAAERTFRQLYPVPDLAIRCRGGLGVSTFSIPDRSVPTKVRAPRAVVIMQGVNGEIAKD